MLTRMITAARDDRNAMKSTIAPPPRQIGWSVRLLGISLIALVVVLTRVTGITAQSLWYDEGFTLDFVSVPHLSDLFEKLTNSNGSDALQPLNLLLVYAWTRLTGLSELALRAPSVIFAVIFVAAAYWAINDPRRPRSSSLYAAAISAGSAFSIYYAQEARPYALLQMVSMLSLGVWLRLRLGDGAELRSVRRWSLIKDGVSVLCSFVGIFSILYLTSLALTDLIEERNLRAWLGRWWPAICASAFFVALYGSFLRFSALLGGGAISRRQGPIWTNIAYSVYGLLFGTTLLPPQEQLRGADKYAIVLSHWPTVVCALAVIGSLSVGVRFYAATARANSRHVIRSLTLVIVLYSGLLLLFYMLTSLNFQPAPRKTLLDAAMAPRHYSACHLPAGRPE